MIHNLKTALAAGVVLALCGTAYAQDLHAFADSSRLVSIGGSLTEIIYALEQEDKLVARDDTALFPEAAMALPSVGYARQLAPEGVLSVGPSALLVLEGSGPPEALAVLEQAGVEYQSVPESYSHGGIVTKVRAVGTVLGVSDAAEALVATVDAELAAVEARTADIAERKRVLFILSTEGGKIQASGTDTAADGLITLAGAVNAIDEYQGYKALTEEAIIEAAPDVILMMDRGGDHGATDAELLANPAIALTEAGRTGAILRYEGSYLLGFGPRTPAAVGEVVDALYGAQ